jgi:hypothetical protein
MIFELHKNKVENSQILKQYTQQYFPPCKAFKMTRRKLKILEFQNTEMKDFKVHKKKGT